MAFFITSLTDAVVHSRSLGRAGEGSYRDRSPPALPPTLERVFSARGRSRALEGRSLVVALAGVARL
ncbi:unnamed protein product [Spirodela intermedia]|nr:unnamed protein product [Spirodela intermedia]CAA6672737.1 unnamed protein product [Spirodela intermedia]